MSSKFPMNPRGPQQQQRPQMPEIDPKALEAAMKSSPTVTCDSCGNATFEEVVLFKKLSKLVSPTGQEGMVPIPAFACNSCGHVNNGFLPEFMRVNPTIVTPTDAQHATIQATGVATESQIKLV